MKDFITCPNCGIENSLNRCTGCESSLIGNKNDVDRSQLLVLWGIILISTVTIYWFVLDLVIIATENYDLYDFTQYVDNFMSLILAGTPILFVLSLKNKTYRIIGIVFGSAIFAVRVYWVIKSLIPTEEFVYFQF